MSGRSYSDTSRSTHRIEERYYGDYSSQSRHDGYHHHQRSRDDHHGTYRYKRDRESNYDERRNDNDSNSSFQQNSFDDNHSYNYSNNSNVVRESKKFRSNNNNNNSLVQPPSPTRSKPTILEQQINHSRIRHGRDIMQTLNKGFDHAYVEGGYLMLQKPPRGTLLAWCPVCDTPVKGMTNLDTKKHQAALQTAKSNPKRMDFINNLAYYLEQH